MSVTLYYLFFNCIILIAVSIGLFAIAYFLIKRAVKNGILEAYKEIHKEQ